MRVLVCGGREFDDWALMNRVLARHFGHIVPTIIEGGATGADFLARVYAKYYNLPHEQFPTDWKTHGKAAGAIRNQQMLDQGKPDVVVAFPGSNGTADMVRRAKNAGIKVYEVEE